MRMTRSVEPAGGIQHRHEYATYYALRMHHDSCLNMLHKDLASRMPAAYGPDTTLY